MPVQTPDWVKNAVFYQIFPDRFARGQQMQHPPGIQLKPWGTPPDEQGYQGGDLYGVLEKLDYLQDLGITAIYFNPIFSSAANHRYHTFDYYEVDPLLGGNAALRALLDEAHARDMRIVLDGVFNHASRGFWQFHHILENGSNSPYLDWFHIQGYPLRPYQHDQDNPPNYAGWWGLPMLPEFNTDNPGVRDFIFGVAEYWIEFGIDGWRLDVPFEIDDDAFWREFRDRVKAINPQAYIVGEVWEEAVRWLQGDMFDAVMNYTIAWSSLSFFGAETLRENYDRNHYRLEPFDAGDFASAITENLERYDYEINLAQLNLLDSHDTARALWIVDGAVDALQLCVLFQMTMPGAPCVYYGDEIGMSAGDDPWCREAFPWDAEDTWNTALRQHYQRAIQMRHAHPVLRTGDFEVIHQEGSIFGFKRTLGDTVALVVFNTSADDTTLDIHTGADDAATLQAVWGGDDKVSLVNGTATVTIPARDALVLVSE